MLLSDALVVDDVAEEEKSARAALCMVYLWGKSRKSPQLGVTDLSDEKTECERERL